MTGARRVIAVALADFRERSRTPTLLIVPVVLAYFVKLVTVDTTLYVAGGFTGALNAAWFGGAVAGISTVVLLLIGYPLVTGSVRRDRETGVGELLAAAPLSNPAYLLGKWLSNLALLTVVTAIVAAATIVSFLLQGTGPLDVLAVLSPFVFLTLPAMAIVAAAAVCAETIAPLRGGFGTAAYFLAVLALVALSVRPGSSLDFVGITALRESMAVSIAAQYPEFEGPVTGFAYGSVTETAKTFTWSGLAVTRGLLVSRLQTLGVTAVLLAVAGVAFDRFDESDGGHSDDSDAPASETASPAAPQSEPSSVAPDVGSVERVSSGGFTLSSVLLGELRLSLRGRQWWWYLSCGVVAVAAALAPIGAVRSLVVPIGLLLLLPLWSSLGARERRHQTEELVFVNGGAIRLLAVSYVVGAAAGLALVSPALVRFAVAGSWPALLGGLAGVLFVPAAAAAFGVWTTPRAFELAYLAAWYLGPMNGLRPLDYVGVRATSLTLPTVYLGLTALALGVAVVGRRRW